MRWIVLVLLALICVVTQQSWLAQWPLAPDLPLALLAWVVVDGEEQYVVVRAFVIGLVRDCVDPGSVVFHTLAYSLIALLFLPVRGLVFRTRAAAWAGLAAAASLTLAAFDRWLGGGEPGWIAPGAIAALTAAATIPLGWPFRYAPALLHPAGRGGA